MSYLARRGIYYENGSVPAGSTNSQQSHQLTEIVNDYGLEQIVKSPTYFTASPHAIIDLFFINNSPLVNKFEVIPGISYLKFILNLV